MNRKFRNLKLKKRSEGIAFLNTNTDSSNDAKGELDLSPGEKAYADYLDHRRDELKKQNREALHLQQEELEIEDRQPQIKRIRKEKIEKAYNDVGRRKYRRYMSKDVQVKKMTGIIDDGLGRHISRKDFNDELYDDGISGDEFPKESVRDYKKEFEKKRELPTEDTNHDNVIDENDEPVMTPGMRRLAKYM